MNIQRTVIVSVIVLILLLPLVTNAPWTLSDYIIGGIILFVTGLAIDTALTNIKNRRKMILTVTGVLLVTVYIWAELAVGIFTNLGS